MPGKRELPSARQSAALCSSLAGPFLLIGGRHGQHVAVFEHQELAATGYRHERGVIGRTRPRSHCWIALQQELELLELGCVEGRAVA